FGTLADFGDGLLLVAFEGAGPKARLRCAHGSPDASLDVFDGENWLDTGLDLRPRTRTRLRTEIDFSKGTFSLHVKEGALPETVAKEGVKFAPFPGPKTRRRIESSGKPAFPSRIFRWEAWDASEPPGIRRTSPSGATEFAFGLPDTNPGWAGVRLAGPLGVDVGPPGTLRLHPPAGFPEGFRLGSGGWVLRGAARVEGGRIVLGGKGGVGRAERAFRLPAGPVRVETAFRLPPLQRREERAFTASFETGDSGFEFARNPFEEERQVAAGADVTPERAGMRKKVIMDKDAMVAGSREIVGGRGETKKCLEIRLGTGGGRKDTAVIRSVSAGWCRSIKIEPGTAFLKVRANVRVLVGRDEEPMDWIEFRGTLDGRPPLEATVLKVPGANRREPVDTGWRDLSLVFAIGEGSAHELLLGASLTKPSGTHTRVPSHVSISRVEASVLSIVGPRGERCGVDDAGRAGVLCAELARTSGGRAGPVFEVLYDLPSDRYRLAPADADGAPLYLAPSGGDVRMDLAAEPSGVWRLRLSDGFGKALGAFSGGKADPNPASWAGEEAVVQLRTLGSSGPARSDAAKVGPPPPLDLRPSTLDLGPAPSAPLPRPEVVALSASAAAARSRAPFAARGAARSLVLDAGSDAVCSRLRTKVRASVSGPSGGALRFFARSSNERFSSGDANPAWAESPPEGALSRGRFFQWRAEFEGGALGESPGLEHLAVETVRRGTASSGEGSPLPIVLLVLPAIGAFALARWFFRRKPSSLVVKR
ncbi:MAG: hypothetical protein AAB215_08695, partial [Planctomycetota bacterium]